MAIDREKFDAHIVQWKHNRSLIGQIPASHPDWIVTVVFYTAVHAVDTALAFDGLVPWSHETRFETIAASNRYARIGKLYHPLYDLCRKVRYTATPDLWIPREQIDQQVVRGILLPLENSVMNLINAKLELPTIDLSHLVAKKA